MDSLEPVIWNTRSTENSKSTTFTLSKWSAVNSGYLDNSSTVLKPRLNSLAILHLLYTYWVFVGLTFSITPRQARNRMFCYLRKQYVLRNPRQYRKQTVFILECWVWARQLKVPLRMASFEFLLLEILVAVSLVLISRLTKYRVKSFDERFMLDTRLAETSNVFVKIVASS